MACTCPRTATTTPEPVCTQQHKTQPAPCPPLARPLHCPVCLMHALKQLPPCSLSLLSLPCSLLLSCSRSPASCKLRRQSARCRHHPLWSLAPVTQHGLWVCLRCLPPFPLLCTSAHPAGICTPCVPWCLMQQPLTPRTAALCVGAEGFCLWHSCFGTTLDLRSTTQHVPLPNMPGVNHFTAFQEAHRPPRVILRLLPRGINQTNRFDSLAVGVGYSGCPGKFSIIANGQLLQVQKMGMHAEYNKCSSVKFHLPHRSTAGLSKAELDRMERRYAFLLLPLCCHRCWCCSRLGHSCTHALPD